MTHKRITCTDGESAMEAAKSQWGDQYDHIEVVMSLNNHAMKLRNDGYHQIGTVSVRPSQRVIVMAKKD